MELSLPFNWTACEKNHYRHYSSIVHDYNDCSFDHVYGKTVKEGAHEQLLN